MMDTAHFFASGGHRRRVRVGIPPLTSTGGRHERYDLWTGFFSRTCFSAIVVHDQVEIQPHRHPGLDISQELQEFAAAVATVHLADDRSLGDVQGRKQRGRPMALVAMGATLGDARGERQQGLRAAQSLDPALLAQAQQSS